MIAGSRFLAIVPARGGSKGVPRKNVRPLGGKPLIAYTAAQITGVPEIDLAVVSTEDPEIKSIAEDLGLRVIDRPGELATDEARTEPAMLHVLDELAGGPPFDYVVLLQPTSPLRRPETILACMKRLAAGGGDSLVTVCEINELIGGLEDGFFRPFFPEDRKRRQDRSPRYALNGCIFACSVAHLRATGELMAEDWLAHEISGADSLDIDTMDDFTHAEHLLLNQG